MHGADDTGRPEAEPEPSGPRSYRRLGHEPEEWPAAAGSGLPTDEEADASEQAPAEDTTVPAEEEAPSPPPQPLAADELLTVSEVAELAGVHENTVRKHIKSATVPFFIRDLATGEIISGDIPHDQWPARYQYLLSAEVVAHLASQAGDTVTPSAPEQAAQPAATTSSEALSQEASRLRSELSAAERDLSTVHEQLQELRGERDWLRTHLRDITAFLPAAREQSDHVRSDLESAQDNLHAAQADLERLHEQTQRLQRQRDLERQARRLAAIRFRGLSWWRRMHTDLEALVQEELSALADDEPPAPGSA